MDVKYWCTAVHGTIKQLFYVKGYWNSITELAVRTNGMQTQEINGKTVRAQPLFWR